MSNASNPELELAEAYVKYTDRNVFLTGKAGTGKTTFLHRIRREVFKRNVVLAPTGVAAINAAGMTLHSFFQLPLGLYLPGTKREEFHRYGISRQKRSLIRSLDLLIIDEVSMVRADLLDAVDEALRRHRRNQQPFGGVQLLLIGDLHQLPPIVKDEEWDLLSKHYDTPFFFSSKALRSAGYVPIELKHIYRQQDEDFIFLLNKIRHGHFDEQVLKMLDSRYQPDFTPRPDEGYIALTTHNAIADEINQQNLDKIDATATCFQAKIEGQFPEYIYPAEPELKLKPGAQVMFIKNDPSTFERKYFNGKIGYVSRIEPRRVFVKCSDQDEEIEATPVTWENIRYELDPATNTIREEVIGMFEQIPLRLAWAVTIHKSQGLTFDRVIIDAEAAFAHGQVYVALSRCRTLEGVVLRTRIHRTSLRTNAKVQSFSEESARKAPNFEQLRSDQAVYQQKLLLELFEFRQLKGALESLKRTFIESPGSFVGNPSLKLNTLAEAISNLLEATGKTFCQQLVGYYFQSQHAPEDNPALQERLRKAGSWYTTTINEKLLPLAADIILLSDNKVILETARKKLGEIEWQLFSKKMLFEQLAAEGFSVRACLQTRIDAEVAFEKWKVDKQLRESKEQLPVKSLHAELYRQLLEWRQLTANRSDSTPHHILPTAVLDQITRILPNTSKQLLRIKGFGKKRLELYGAQILQIVKAYCEVQGHKPVPLPEGTREVTLQMLRQGKSISDIALLRGLAISTIEGHLATLVEKGKVSVDELLDHEKLTFIQTAIEQNPQASLSELKQLLGSEISYGEIKIVQAHLNAIKNGLI